MRFFDEDNRRFEWTMGIAVLLAVLYIGSFCVIRVRASSDDCGLRRIDFPTKPIRTVYRPLIELDKQINYNVIYQTEIDEVRFAAKYFCGE